MDVKQILDDPFAYASNKLNSGGKGARQRAYAAQQEEETWGRMNAFTAGQQEHERNMQADRFTHEQTILGGQQNHELKMVREHGKQHRLNVDQAHHLPGGSTVQWGQGTGMVVTPAPKKRTPKPPAP